MTNEDQNSGPDGKEVNKLSSREEIKSELSKVASNPKQNTLIIVLVFLVGLYLAYNIYQNSIPEEDKISRPKVEIPKNLVRNDMQSEADLSDIEVPTLPEPPKLTAPSAPPPPPPPPLLPKKIEDAPTPPPLPSLPNLINPEVSAEDAPKAIKKFLLTPDEEKSMLDREKRKKEKRSSSIILAGGAEGDKSKIDEKKEALSTSVLKRNSNVDHLKYLVLNKGKIIDAVLETAINSDTGSVVRAIISKDVYADQGRSILIPKGSEILGEFKANLNSGRVEIGWTRLNLDNNYYLELSDISVDNLGRIGTQGRLDSKDKEKVLNTVFMSAFNIGVAGILESITATIDPNQASKKGLNDSISVRSIVDAATKQDSTADDKSKISKICTEVSNFYLENQYTDLYAALQKQCDTSSSGTDHAKNLDTLSIFVNNQALGLIQATNIASQTLSKSAQASQGAFDQFTALTKEMIESDKFKATITMDQGSSIKIYLTKDYFFPKEVVRAYQREYNR